MRNLLKIRRTPKWFKILGLVVFGGSVALNYLSGEEYLIFPGIRRRIKRLRKDCEEIYR